MNKKTKIAIISVIALILVTIGITYAYWLVTKTQTGENEITAGCLDITISGEKNDIELTNQFPMSDEEGMELVPYEFTVTNNCNTSVDYQVALEATGTESSAIKTSALKVALNDSISLLSSKVEVETTIEGAYESRVLGFAKLAAAGNEGSSATYNLRIWIDADAPISEMNKTFKSKISVTIGQGIESGFEEGTLAYSILSNVGGTGAANEIDVDELDHRIVANDGKYMGEYNLKYFGTNYTFDETTKEYKLSGNLVEASIADCRNGYQEVIVGWDDEIGDDIWGQVPIECGKYTLARRSSDETNSTLYEVINFQSSGESVTANIIKYVNAFGKVTDSSEAGLYKTQDDLGDSYYYRGNVTNNYVQFGSYAANSTVNGTTYTEETPMYWRIVRINGDGTIRLVYDGTTKAQNGVFRDSMVGTSAYNTNSDDAKYVGYTYEGTNETGETIQVDSTIKGALDIWYDTYLEANYGGYIADSIFCNDRSISEAIYFDENNDEITDPNAAEYSYIYYGAYQRLRYDISPSLRCANQSDRYTVDDTTNGNGLLSNPVGLLTADEVAFAGEVEGYTNSSFYLYNGDSYWFLTPEFWNNNDEFQAVVRAYNRDGFFRGFSVDYEYGVRPVINLKADVEFTGDGTIDNPYKIVTE